MEISLVFQYILLALVVIFACYSIYRKIKNTFSSKNNKGCDKGCGCS